MTFDLASLLLGLLAGSFITACLAFPLMGRAVAKILGVLLLGVGIGLLGWSILAMARGDSIRPPAGLSLITEVSEAFGWGLGFLFGGFLAMIMVRRGRRTPAQVGEAVPEPK